MFWVATLRGVVSLFALWERAYCRLLLLGGLKCFGVVAERGNVLVMSGGSEVTVVTSHSYGNGGWGGGGCYKLNDRVRCSDPDNCHLF